MKRKGPLRRTVIMLDEDAHLLLERLTTPRRKGAFLSNLIRRAAAPEASPISDDAHLLQGIEERLARIEETLAATGEVPAAGQQAHSPAANQK